MDEPVAPQQRRGSTQLARALQRSRLLAFASLIALIVVFSLASPNFFKFDNIVAILLATAVNGVLALAVTFVIITARHRPVHRHADDLLRRHGGRLRHQRGTCRSRLGVLAGGRSSGALAGLVSGRHHRQAEDPALHRDPGHDVRRQGPVPDHLRPQADLLQRHADVHPDRHGIADRVRSSPGFDDPQRGADPVRRRASSPAWSSTKTILGRYTFAMGSNEEAMRLSGVNVDRWKIVVYTLCGLICGLAGVVIAARLNSAQPVAGAGLRARRHRGGGHRRHVPERRRGHHPGHGHRRVRHERR